jgi:hypothetical protein
MGLPLFFCYIANMGLKWTKSFAFDIMCNLSHRHETFY